MRRGVGRPFGRGSPRAPRGAPRGSRFPRGVRRRPGPRRAPGPWARRVRRAEDDAEERRREGGCRTRPRRGPASPRGASRSAGRGPRCRSRARFGSRSAPLKSARREAATAGDTSTILLPRARSAIAARSPGWRYMACGHLSRASKDGARTGASSVRYTSRRARSAKPPSGPVRRSSETPATVGSSKCPRSDATQVASSTKTPASRRKRTSPGRSSSRVAELDGVESLEGGGKERRAGKGPRLEALGRRVAEEKDLHVGPRASKRGEEVPHDGPEPQAGEVGIPVCRGEDDLQGCTVRGWYLPSGPKPCSQSPPTSRRPATRHPRTRRRRTCRT